MVKISGKFDFFAKIVCFIPAFGLLYYYKGLTGGG